jgi:hypothetical protein
MPRSRTLCRLDGKMRPGTDFWKLLLPSRYSSSYRRYLGLILAPDVIPSNTETFTEHSLVTKSFLKVIAS